MIGHAGRVPFDVGPNSVQATACRDSASTLEDDAGVVTRQQFAELALSLPETAAKSHFSQPDFRVCGKIFCGLDRADERGYLKLPKEAQSLLAGSRPDAFAPAAGAWGESGWTYVMLPRVALAELRELLSDAWRQVAPKRLAVALPASDVVVSVRTKREQNSRPARAAKRPGKRRPRRSE